jgi:hypothetical protein
VDRLMRRCGGRGRYVVTATDCSGRSQLRLSRPAATASISQCPRTGAHPRGGKYPLYFPIGSKLGLRPHKAPVKSVYVALSLSIHTVPV